MSEALGRVARVRLADVAPGTLKRSPAYHLARLARIARAAATLVAQGLGPDRRLYLCIAGGAGVYYDLVLAALARLLRYRIFIHHHSFTYVNRRDRRTALLFRLCGTGAVHICLCQTMAQRLRARYPRIDRCEILSNAALLPAPEPGELPPRGDGSVTLGHLGNLTLAKGLDTVVALFHRLRAEGLPVRLSLAGPAAGEAESRLIDGLRRDFPGAVAVHGPLYGAEKDAFFRDLDVFLFPSRYPNEAQPLVLFEAMAAGVPVIATGRGCIGDDVTGGAGLVSDEAAFLDSAAALIRHWYEDRASLRAAGRAARERVRALREAARCDLDHIVGLIAGINVLEAGACQNGYADAGPRRHAKSLGAHAGHG
ncbi:MAG: glycosyltransferase family 4 protein [Rhodospirillaceae bacterium]|nr:glycosyltransferase family 4 protein [Rhodospirillaceae bacterium]